MTLLFFILIEKPTAISQSNPNIIINSDIANLNDFNDFEIQSIDINDDIKLASNMNNKILDNQQSLRPLSAVSTASNEMIENSNLATMNNFCDNFIEQSYVQLKILCVEQIKKPGRDYSSLFSLIQNCQLSIRMRLFLLKELLYEATRFKRLKLIESINKYSDLLQQI